jgi:hypothetical protein
MSNIAGKAYAMNVVTPIRWYTAWINKAIFFVAGLPLFGSALNGLLTLSLIHYARWVIVRSSQFPRLSDDQPREDLKYTYMFFFSNFNGSWEQYVDSFSSAIPGGLDLFWKWNVGYPKSIPMEPFHAYICFNQIATDHYYSAYPMAAANDVKSAKRVKACLLKFQAETQASSASEFQVMYNRLLLDLQHDLSQMDESPVVSLSAAAVLRRHELESLKPTSLVE